MDLMKTIIVYMSLAMSSAVGNAPMPTPTPTAAPTPAPIVTPASTQQAVTTATVKPTSKPTATPRPQPVQAPDMTPNPSYPLLRNGSRGDAVLRLQKRLRELGYMEAEADGVYGNRTKGAVMRFQQAHGLTRDGVAGKHTQTILFEYDKVVPAGGITPTPAPSAQPTLTPEPQEVPLPRTENGLTVLQSARILVDGMERDGAGLLALSSEMDVLADLEGLTDALEWDPDPLEAGLGWQFELGVHEMRVSYTLKDEKLDTVRVTVDGEDVELTEDMTGLIADRLFLAPVWLEAMGATVAWDGATRILSIEFPQ